MMSVLRSVSAVSFLGLVLLAGCGVRATTDSASSAPTRPATAAGECEPTFLRLNEKALEVWSGSWRFGFDVFLVGCRGDLNQVTDEDRQSVATRLEERVREEGLSFFAGQRERAHRLKLVADLNAALRSRILSDILTTIRYSTEHEPAGTQDSDEESGSP